MPILTTKKSNMTASLTLINCSLRVRPHGWSRDGQAGLFKYWPRYPGWYKNQQADMNTNIKIHCTLIMCVHKGSHEWSRDGCVGVRAYRPAWVSEPTGTTEAQHRPPWGQLSGFCASLSLLSKSPPLACFAHHFQSTQPRILSSCIWIPATLHCSSCFKTLKRCHQFCSSRDSLSFDSGLWHSPDPASPPIATHHLKHDNRHFHLKYFRLGDLSS